MNYLKHILLGLAACATISSCSDLDIEPKNIISGSDIYSEGGITAYMAGLYGRLPMEDFNMTDDGGGKDGFFGWNCIVWDMVSTGESVNRNQTGLYVPQKGYWSEGFKVIRQANVLIEDLPQYVGTLTGAESWIAEAKFIRAYTYFAMVKRYGGMPIITKPQQATGNDADLWVARSSHEDCIDFILEDLDYAIENMTANKVAGRANRYVAAAFKSRVALYAASVAKYGEMYNYSVDGVQVCGLPASRANDYFTQAYKAALETEKGGYALYEADADKSENFRNVFLNADKSSESVFVRQYNINNNVHSFDAVYCPPRMTTTYGDRYNVTLDWVELFDGLPLDPATGHLKVGDEDGNYIVFNDEKELFANAEPRLKGSIMIPGETYKGVCLDIRAGLIKENVDPSTPIAKFVADDGQTTTAWSNVDWFKNNVVVASKNPKDGESYAYNGANLKINGSDGPTTGGGPATLTGFHGLKWINTNWTVAETQLHRGTQTWIDIRYAEVLLNRAEAAVELAQNGVTTLDGKSLLNDAMECMNKVRSRAGATLIASTAELSSTTPMLQERGTGINSFVFAPNKGLHAVRVERYKELAFEHKIYWDLRRWFTFDTQIHNYRRRMLAPFMFVKDATVDAESGNPVGKYIYETRVCERANNSLSFATKNYYDQIPNGQRTLNPLLVQNNQY